MNDFTLEELQIIHLDMNAYIHRTTILAESPSHRALRDKVESMIDNYYEHDVKSIAKAHLNEASSLISHAMCLLGIENE